MLFELHYSLNARDAWKWGIDGSSGIIGYEPMEQDEAEELAKAINEDPEAHGHCEWMKDASVWAEPAEEKE